MRKLFKVLMTTVTSLIVVCAHADLGRLPVQDGGRVKPFDTFAREMLSLLWGKESYQGRPATEIVFSWLLAPEEWAKTDFILVRHSGLREALNLSNTQLYYSPMNLLGNDRLGLLIQDIKAKREAEEKLNPFDQAVQTLENQLLAFQGVRSGLALRVLPPADDQSTAWRDLTQVDGEFRDKFQVISQKFIALAVAMNRADKGAEGEARGEMKAAVDDYIKKVESSYGDYAHATKIKAELFYNRSHPFRWAWGMYLVALILFSFSYFGSRSAWEKMAWPALALGFVAHTVGFGLRVYILERAPVTNMFETVVWVAWVTLILATVFYKINRSKILPVAASMVAVLSLILCDVSSSVLDDTLTPLEPVLRDNFWLLTHVVIIVSSYAAFFLAFFIADILLYYFLKDEKGYQVQIQQGVQAIYRSIQVGVVLLATGVILGGVWADYSWGRFWGWDPKETWAFIALLGYLVILHGRLAGWLRGFGLTVSAIVAFSLVLMAWYGVNFVLGAGLHTYGFGAGGVEYVTGFVVVHMLLVAYVTTLRQSRLKASKTSSNLR